MQFERHAAQAAIAQTAKVQLRKETEWMRRQPKARSTKAKFRQDAFYELSDKARSAPKQEAKADFGAGTMARQVSSINLLLFIHLDDFVVLVLTLCALDVALCYHFVRIRILAWAPDFSLLCLGVCIGQLCLALALVDR